MKPRIVSFRLRQLKLQPRSEVLDRIVGLVRSHNGLRVSIDSDTRCQRVYPETVVSRRYIERNLVEVVDSAELPAALAVPMDASSPVRLRVVVERTDEEIIWICLDHLVSDFVTALEVKDQLEGLVRRNTMQWSDYVVEERRALDSPEFTSVLSRISATYRTVSPSGQVDGIGVTADLNTFPVGGYRVWRCDAPAHWGRLGERLQLSILSAAAGLFSYHISCAFGITNCPVMAFSANRSRRGFAHILGWLANVVVVPFSWPDRTLGAETIVREAADLWNQAMEFDEWPALAVREALFGVSDTARAPGVRINVNAWWSSSEFEQPADVRTQFTPRATDFQEGGDRGCIDLTLTIGQGVTVLRLGYELGRYERPEVFDAAFSATVRDLSSLASASSSERSHGR